MNNKFRIKTISELIKYLKETAKELPEGMNTRVFISSDEEGNKHCGISSYNGHYKYILEPKPNDNRLDYRIKLGVEDTKGAVTGLFIYPDESVTDF